MKKILTIILVLIAMALYLLAFWKILVGVLIIFIIGIILEMYNGKSLKEIINDMIS